MTIVALIVFWIAPIVVTWGLCERDGKDPVGPLLGAIFLSWLGGLLIWAIIDPDEARLERKAESDDERWRRKNRQREEIERKKDQQYLAEKRAAQESRLTPERRAKLEKLLIAPKKKSR